MVSFLIAATCLLGCREQVVLDLDAASEIIAEGRYKDERSRNDLAKSLKKIASQTSECIRDGLKLAAERKPSGGGEVSEALAVRLLLLLAFKVWGDPKSRVQLRGLFEPIEMTTSLPASWPWVNFRGNWTLRPFWIGPHTGRASSDQTPAFDKFASKFPRRRID